MPNAIRAILIDPFSRTVSETTLPLANDPGHLTAFYNTIQCGTVERVTLGGGVDGWIDEEGMLCNWDDQRFFSLIAYVGEPSPPFAGRMILTCSTPDGDTASLHPAITTQAVHAIVRWVDAKDVRIPAPTYQECDENMQPVGEPVPLHGTDTHWTYDNQP